MSGKIVFIVSLFLFMIASSVADDKDKDLFLIFPPMPVGVPETISNNQCQLDNNLFQQNLNNLTLWAYEMYDASAKTINSGVLRGNSYNLGHFDQCLSVAAPFKTQYCLAEITAHVRSKYSPKDPLSLHYDPYGSVLSRLYNYVEDDSKLPRNIVRLAWCVPASCTPPDLTRSLNTYLSTLPRSHTITYKSMISPIHCQIQDEYVEYTVKDIMFCILTLTIIVAVIVATLYDLMKIDGEKPNPAATITVTQTLIDAFSMIRNTTSLCKSNESSEDDKLKVLYGVKFVATITVMFMHRLIFTLITPVTNADRIEQTLRSKAMMFYSRGDYPPDVFFFSSGLLVTYGLLVHLDKAKIHAGFIVFLRYIRLTPVYAYVILFTATMYRRLGFGPMWPTMSGPDEQHCRTNWWLNLLYLNNYVKPHESCIPQSWYLACEFQFFLMTIALCLLIHKHKRIGLMAIAILTALSILIPFVIMLENGGFPIVMLYPEKLTHKIASPQIMFNYVQSHTRASTYMIGVIVGYMYYKMRDGAGKQLSNHHRIISNVSVFKTTKSNLILLVSVVLMLATSASGVLYYDVYRKFTPIESALYCSLSRPIYALGLSGLLYVVCYGPNRLLFRICTWHPFVVLGKLGYGVYLTHLAIEQLSVSSHHYPQHFSLPQLHLNAILDVIVSFAVSFLLHVCVEAPVKKIVDALMRSPARHKSHAKHE